MAFFVFDKGIIKLAIMQTRLASPAGEAERSKSPVFEILEPSYYSGKVYELIKIHTMRMGAVLDTGYRMLVATMRKSRLQREYAAMRLMIIR